MHGGQREAFQGPMLRGMKGGNIVKLHFKEIVLEKVWSVEYGQSWWERNQLVQAREAKILS